MRRIFLAAALVLVGAATASAHPFTLKAARQTARSYDRWAKAPNAVVGRCEWARPRAARCYVSLTASVLVGQAASVVSWSEVVTRDNRCHAWFYPDWCYHGLTVSP